MTQRTSRAGASKGRHGTPTAHGGDAFDWTDLDRRSVDTVRGLAMDAVERSGNGHPGTAMSLAPVAQVLFQRVMRHDPRDAEWAGRDRFVLSVGHSSLTLYIQLFLCGYGLQLSDLERLRQWESLTPGHPEYGHTVGVEVTTGPLGQGLANAVGMAMSARRVRGLLDPEAGPGESPFDHTIWVFAGDGDMEEGVASEASSLAGHQLLGNLVLVYDDNHISIEGDTDVAFSEDVLARYAAYGWHTHRVDDAEDAAAVHGALVAAEAETDRPSIIAVRSVIGYPAPTKQGTGKAHGSALGAEEVAATKRVLGMDPDESFQVPHDVLAYCRQAADRGAELHATWDKQLDSWAAANPAGKELLDRLRLRRLPVGWESALPAFEPSEKGMATRVASGEVLSALQDVLPELWGGSADLAGSNNTTMAGADSFLPAGNEAKGANPYGRTLHFGVREHAMGAVMNGIATGLTRVYGGTFFVFADYMRPPVRLAALMHLPVIYVWTHDSIGLGEDGPTHQPVEHLWAYRAIPGLDVVRPCDANETVVAYRTVLEAPDHPAAMVLSRQDLPVLDRAVHATADLAEKGGYILAEASGGWPTVIVMASGSEVHVALAARERLEAEGTPTRVVSMPCLEWFDAQPPAYRQHVLPPHVRCRVSVEAGVAQGWPKYLGEYGEAVCLEHFGASAPYRVLFEQFGFTPDHVVAAAHGSLSRIGAMMGEETGN